METQTRITLTAVLQIRTWRDNPVQFVRDNFGVDPDDWQIEVLEAFARNQRICLKASKGVGKTAVLAWCIWNFLATRPHPKVACTSISWDNLADGLWTELAYWQSKSEFLKSQFEWTKTRIFHKQFSETWWASARSWSKSATSDQQSNALAGLHADYMLFVLDESGGIPDSVMAAAEAALSTGIDLKLIQAGNPTHLEGPLYRACTKERHLWWVKEISSDPDDPKRAKRVSKQWAKEQIDKYGKDNPWVLVNVFGQFPPNSVNTLLGPDEVSKAIGRHINEADYSFSQKRLGVDVARFGMDSTVIFPRQGLATFNPVEMRNARSNEIAARVITAKVKWGSELEFIDDTGGFGSGVVDSMIQAGHSPQAINFASKPNNPRYMNKRAEMWFELAEWIKRGGILPNIPRRVAELTSPTYTIITGKFAIEPKDQIKERLGFSPDYADALCLTFALAEMPGTPQFPGYKSSAYKKDYDPFE